MFLWEERIRTQHRAHRPSLRMGKGLFMHQSKPDTWTKFDDGTWTKPLFELEE